MSSFKADSHRIDNSVLCARTIPTRQRIHKNDFIVNLMFRRISSKEFIISFPAIMTCVQESTDVISQSTYSFGENINLDKSVIPIHRGVLKE